MCETLMLDVMVPEAHQNDRSSVRVFNGLTFDSLNKNLAWWAVTRRTSKHHKCQNCRVSACSGQYGISLEVSQKWLDSHGCSHSYLKQGER